MDIRKNLIVTAIPLFVGIIVAIIKMRMDANKADVKKRRAVAAKKYAFFYNNVMLRKSFRHLVELYSSLACYDFEVLQEITTALFMKALAISVAIPVVTLIVEQDPILVGFAVLVGYLYFQLTVIKSYDKEIENMTNEISLTIQSISDSYSLVDDVAKAVKICDRAPCLERSINRIYEILAAENKEESLYRYKQLSPIRLLSSLASTCYITSEEGDSRDENGLPKFVQKMTHLRLEADSKARNLRETAIAFSALTTLSLTGMIATPVIDTFMLRTMPGTSVYLKGLYGTVEKSMILGITCLSYYVISLLRRPTIVNVVDKMELIDKISKYKKVKAFTIRLIPKTYKSEEKWKNRLNESLSAKDMNYIYTLKPILAAIAAVVAIISLIISNSLAKARLWNNYNSLEAINYSIEMTETMHRALVEIDKEYLTQDEKPKDEFTRNLVKGRTTGLTDLEVEQQVDRLSMKWDKYYGISFKWWYWLIIYAVSIVAWFVPEMSLMIRKFLVKFEVAEDVMQIQSLMVTLQSTKFDVRKCLYWMTQESTIHKAVLQYAYIEYSSDPELALLRLKDSVGLRDMKRIVAKLEKAIYDLSIEDAFRDIALDKQNSLTINEMLQKQQLASKREMARGLANAPLMIALVCGFLIPLLALGLTQLLSALSEMGV